ncbi:MAG: TlpA disulfide reductase family protein [Gammaproteobacteria bacterium]|nr:TlpA disulfide reductase family protein [Gammaproteobacteria bacterium]MDE0252792.1 TlpA disulfide reductase family protein [Gammaproteobacteria bacterium]MDE0402199.1 TlpA disulfide reductase family protein [Gammaproteobacteria bacterium]
MKKYLVTILGLFVITLTITSCQMMNVAGPQNNSFIINGEIIYVADEPTTEHELRVTVTSNATDESEEIPPMEITSGEFKNRKIRLRGTVDQAVPVTLSVVKNEEVIGSTNFLLLPNSKNKFEVLDNVSTQEVFLKGSDHRSTDPERRFTFSGDLKQFTDYDPELTHVSVYGRSYELDGSPTKYTKFGPVLLENGKFSIEGDLDKPTLFSLWIEEFGSYSMIISLDGIFEPGMNYGVEQVGSTDSFVISADHEGLHTRLVTSWMNDPEYMKLREQQSLAYAEWEKSFETSEEVDPEVVSDTEDTEEVNTESPDLTFASTNPPAAECQHVDLTTIAADTGTGFTMPAGYERVQEFREQLTDKRIESLLPIMQNSDDLDLAWMAFQLNPFGYDRDEEKLAALEELATIFSEEFVEQHITPKIEEVVQRISVIHNDKTVVPGQLAPAFTLDNLEGEAVSLHNVLQENELVLVDFWASWCGPCIASFPALKEMYSTYQNEGFEIITVSIDSTLEDWQAGFEENELPWIDVIDAADDGELKGWQAPMATAYGVNYVPKGFLIDSEGCIVQRDLHTEELENVLAARWDEESAE